MNPSIAVIKRSQAKRLKQAEASLTYITPLGRLDSTLTIYLGKAGIFAKTALHERLISWKGNEGYMAFEALKKDVFKTYCKGNPDYKKHSPFWKDIDYILIDKNKKYTFTLKEKSTQSNAEWQQEVLNFNISDEEVREYSDIMEEYDELILKDENPYVHALKHNLDLRVFFR